MATDSNGVEYIEEQLEDCTQRYYVGGTITFATHPDQEELITEIDAEHGSITTIRNGETEWDLSQSDLRVNTVPHDVLDPTNDKIAPFTICDYNGVEYGTKYWTFHDAYSGAELAASEQQEDMYMHNVFGNECHIVVEYVPDEDDREDEEEDYVNDYLPQD